MEEEATCNRQRVLARVLATRGGKERRRRRRRRCQVVSPFAPHKDELNNAHSVLYSHVCVSLCVCHVPNQSSIITSSPFLPLLSYLHTHTTHNTSFTHTSLVLFALEGLFWGSG